MPDEPTDQEDPKPEDDPKVDEEPADDEPKDDEPPNEDEPKEDEKEALPDWAAAELKEARSEAAKYRVRLREATEKLQAAKTPEEFEAAVSELTEENERLNRELLIASVSREYELPAELAEVLQGSTEEELKAHAEKLKKFVPAPKKKAPKEPSGGLDPDDDQEPFDPVAAAKRARANRY